LKITEARDGTVLMYCHAGCSYGEIAAALGVNGNGSASPVTAPAVADPEPVRKDLDHLSATFQMFLKDSPGQRYLELRGIPIEKALKLEVGYAPPGTWPGRDWRYGRLVFPHTTPDGIVVNLYGRAVGWNDTPPKGLCHDHLPGNKGYFNTEAIRSKKGALYVCEGPFDALSLIAAGHERSIAIFGVNGWRPEWCQGVERIVFAFDNDETGRTRASRLIRDAERECCGFQVSRLPGEWYGSGKDLNEALMKGEMVTT
jgi:DNA primase